MELCTLLMKLSKNGWENKMNEIEKKAFDSVIMNKNDIDSAYGNVYITPKANISVPDLLACASKFTSITTRYGEKMVCFVVSELDGK